MTSDTFLAQFKDWKDSILLPVKLLGVRGYFLQEGKPNVNDLKIFDDAIVRCIENEISIWRASCDPGAYYLKNAINPKGCAQLTNGKWWYKIGRHLNAHEALVQDDDVEVRRLNPKGDVEHIERGYFGINIHSGGSEYQVGSFSAGCQVVQSPEGAWQGTWLNFFEPIKRACEKFNQKRIPYKLVESLIALPDNIKTL